MTSTSMRQCVGCGCPMVDVPRTREHILPRWLASEIEMPGVSLKHYRHDENEQTDSLLRDHSLRTYVIKNVCGPCNNGWMSGLEGRAKPILLGLMNLKRTLLQLSDVDRITIATWAIKTAFMIASAQETKMDLPWHYFRQLASSTHEYPRECPVVSAQLPVSTGFLYACPTDTPTKGGPLSQVRVGFSVRHLHFVVVIPLAEGPRMLRVSGIHLPLWPLEMEILLHYRQFPTITDPKEFINFITGMVEAGLVGSVA